QLLHRLLWESRVQLRFCSIRTTSSLAGLLHTAAEANLSLKRNSTGAAATGNARRGFARVLRRDPSDEGRVQQSKEVNKEEKASARGEASDEEEDPEWTDYSLAYLLLKISGAREHMRYMREMYNPSLH
ncbi:hypothetical protein PMAYCL1PPCAC_19548, partial [Pristionchus mayeri]